MASTTQGLTAGPKSSVGEGVTPGDVTDVARPSSSVDAGRKQSGMHKIEVVGREGERLIQVVDLFDDRLTTILKNEDSGMDMVSHQRIASVSSPRALSQNQVDELLT